MLRLSRELSNLPCQSSTVLTPINRILCSFIQCVSPEYVLNMMFICGVATFSEWGKGPIAEDSTEKE